MSSIVILAQQNSPPVDSMYCLMLLSRILHILGAIILVGGLFYIRFIIPPVNAPPGSTPADQYFGGRRAAWAKWVGIATALLLITGIWNYVQIARTYDLAPSYHMLIGIKMLTGIAVFLLAALLAGRTATADAIRQKWPLWIRITLILGIITVILGSVLRSYPHHPKFNKDAAPQLVAPATNSK